MSLARHCPSVQDPDGWPASLGTKAQLLEESPQTHLKVTRREQFQSKLGGSPVFILLLLAGATGSWHEGPRVRGGLGKQSLGGWGAHDPSRLLPSDSGSDHSPAWASTWEGGT